MNEPKITYLLGAGASYNSVPIVNELGSKFYQYYKTLNTLITNNYEYVNNQDETNNSLLIDDLKKNKEFYKDHIDILKKYFDDMENFMTIDSYAKYLFLTNQINEYHLLKYHFSLFLFIIQVIETDDTSTLSFKLKFNNENKKFIKVDKRYLKFLTTILEKENNSLIFPENIKIISWNYDIQFELALYYFHKTLSVLGYSIFPGNFDWNEFNDVILYHLNGIAGITLKGYKYNNVFNNFLDYTKDINNASIELFTYIKTYFSENRNEVGKNLKFSWERNLFNRNENKYLIKFENHIKESEYLVIIGYSFPDFNVEFDKNIIDSINKQSLKAIYIQNLDEKCVDDFKVKMKLLDSKIDIHFVQNVDEFLTPYSIIK